MNRKSYKLCSQIPLSRSVQCRVWKPGCLWEECYNSWRDENPSQKLAGTSSVDPGGNVTHRTHVICNFKTEWNVVISRKYLFWLGINHKKKPKCSYLKQKSICVGNKSPKNPKCSYLKKKSILVGNKSPKTPKTLFVWCIFSICFGLHLQIGFIYFGWKQLWISS